MFRVYEKEQSNGRLIYLLSELSFAIDPIPPGGGSSIVIDDVQIELDGSGGLLYVWGFCPRQSWKPAHIRPLNAFLGGVRYIGEPIVPGVSKQLNTDRRWDVHYDSDSGWVRIGALPDGAKCVMFAPESVAVLQDGEMVALLLRPEFE